MKANLKAIMASSALLVATPAIAQSTTIYTYDALGRLTGSTIQGGSTNGTTTTIGLDAAGNRTGYRVTSTAGGNNSSGGDDGAAVPATKTVIVLPLNGFTIIPIG